MRDRLIAILKEILPTKAMASGIPVIQKWNYEAAADKLIESGVIAPPLKVGQQVYRIYPHYEQPVFSWIITEIRVLEDEIIFIDDSDNEMKIDEIGKTVFFTLEDAKKALSEREKR